MRNTLYNKIHKKIHYKMLLAMSAFVWMSSSGIEVMAVGPTGPEQAIAEAALRGQIQQEQLQEAQRTAIQRGKRLDGAEQETSGITIDVPTANQTNTNTNTNTTVTTGEGSSEGSVFQVDRIVVDGAANAPWLQAIADAKAGHPMGMTDINTLVGAMNEALVRKGYVTSQVVIPEQTLRRGTLRLVLVWGRLGTVRYAKESAVVPWRNAFPIREGDVLNVRLLEEGLEAMKRLSSQDVTMRLVAGEVPGYTDVELMVTKTKPLHWLYTVDNSGLESTGTVQHNLSVAIDEPFHGDDQLQVAVGGDGERDGYVKGTRSRSVSYTIPFRKERLTVSYGDYKYHQTVHSIPYTFISSGRSQTTRLTWEHLLGRNDTVRSHFSVSAIRRTSHNYIDDMEIDVQSMKTSALEIGYHERRYMGRDTLYTHIGHRFGTAWWGAQEDLSDLGEGLPTTHYKMWLFDVDYIHPFTMGHRPATWTSSFHGQWTTGGVYLYGTDQISIGNRYTVRGFNGEYTLSSESGWYLQNELASRIAPWHSDVYVALDIGAVYGKSVEWLVGRTIMGMAIGMRGEFPSGLLYDVSLGWPLYKPENYHTGKTVGYAMMGWRI